MSENDFEDDPLNQAGQRSWGTAEAMEENAYLAEEITLSVGPMALLGEAFTIIKAQPVALVVIAIVLASAEYGVQASLGTLLSEAFSTILSPKLAAGMTAAVAGMIVFSISLLLQGPLVGVALQSHSKRKNLIGEYGRRAVHHFKGLLALSIATFLISMAAGMAWVAAIFVIGWITGLIGGFVGTLLFVIGSALSGLAAIGAALRFAIASPAMLVERVGAKEALRRSAELTRGSSLAIAMAYLLPVVIWFFSTFLLGLFGILSVPYVGMVWSLGFLALYCMIALALTPGAYLVYRHRVEGVAPAKLAD